MYASWQFNRLFIWQCSSLTKFDSATVNSNSYVCFMTVFRRMSTVLSLISGAELQRSELRPFNKRPVSLFRVDGLEWLFGHVRQQRGQDAQPEYRGLPAAGGNKLSESLIAGDQIVWGPAWLHGQRRAPEARIILPG